MVFEAKSYYAAWVGFELTVFLLLHPKWWGDQARMRRVLQSYEGKALKSSNLSFKKSYDTPGRADPRGTRGRIKASTAPLEPAITEAGIPASSTAE